MLYYSRKYEHCTILTTGVVAITHDTLMQEKLIHVTEKQHYKTLTNNAVSYVCLTQYLSRVVGLNIFRSSMSQQKRLGMVKMRQCLLMWYLQYVQIDTCNTHSYLQ